MKSTIIVFLAISFLFVPYVSEASQFLGGKGVFYTTTAQTYIPGQLGFSLYSRLYTKPLTGIRDVTINTAALCINFGFSNNIEIGVSQVLYQDVNYELTEEDVTYMIPGYTQVNFKMANYKIGVGQNFLFYGGRLSITKQGRYYNSFLEPYYDAGIAGQIDLICSYYWNPYYPEESPALHLNLGYANFNDAEEIMDSGQAMPVAFAYVRSNLKYDYSIEVSGRFFTNKPYKSAYSRESYLYISPGFTYKIFIGLHIGAAFDILVYSEDETTLNTYAPFEEGRYSQYPDWRFNLKVDFSPSTAFHEVPTFEKVSKESLTKEHLRARRAITDKKSLFEWVVDENKGAEYIDLELEKIREERKRAEEELEQLKKEIEEKSK